MPRTVASVITEMRNLDLFMVLSILSTACLGRVQAGDAISGQHHRKRNPSSSNPGLNDLSGSSFSPGDSAPDATNLRLYVPVNLTFRTSR
jgi:hypothetical protein